MSLGIRVESVDGVLLTERWHDVFDQSFTVDDYDYTVKLENRIAAHKLLGKESRDPLLGVMGFSFRERLDIGDVVTVSGPFTSVLAVRGERAPGPRWGVRG